MRKILIFAGILLITLSAGAQDGTNLSVGAFLGLKPGVNGTDAPHGRKNKLAFSNLPDVGLSTYINWGQESVVGARVDVAYTNYTYGIQNYSTGETYDFELHYITLGPSLLVRGFMFGFNFGMPMSAKWEEDIDTEILSTLAEFRFGYNLELFKDETGSLNAFIYMGYMLSGVYSDYEVNDPMKEIAPASPPEVITNGFNPRVASALLGFSYVFSL